MGSKYIKVQSAIEGFRRGGHSFGREPVLIATKELSEEQLAAIKQEPMLVVVECDGEDAGEKPSGSKAGNGKAAKEAAEKEAADKAAKEAADKAAKEAADKAAGKGGNA